MQLEIFRAPDGASGGAYLPSVNQLRGQEARRGALTDELADTLQNTYFGKMSDDVPLLILRGYNVEEEARRRGIDTQPLWNELSEGDRTHVSAWRNFLDDLEDKRTKSALIRVLGVPDTWNLPAVIENRNPENLGELRDLMGNVRAQLGDNMGIDYAFLYRATLSDSQIKIREAVDANIPSRYDDKGYAKWLSKIKGLSSNKSEFLRALLATLKAQLFYQVDSDTTDISDDDIERWAIQERVLIVAARYYGATEYDVVCVYFKAEPTLEERQSRFEVNYESLLDRLGLDGVQGLIKRFGLDA